MTSSEAGSYLRRLPGWKLVNGSIERDFHFKTYRDGLEFAYAVGMLAELQDHHPNIEIRWRRVRLTFYTHVAKGLTQNDFVMAAKSELHYRKINEKP